MLSEQKVYVELAENRIYVLRVFFLCVVSNFVFFKVYGVLRHLGVFGGA